jgi:hypothetical protein
VSTPTFGLSDTSGEAEVLMVDRLRSMSARERIDQVAALNDACEQMAIAGVRSRHPSADEHEVWLRVVALRLGRDLMVAVYGWDPAVEGW